MTTSRRVRRRVLVGLLLLFGAWMVAAGVQTALAYAELDAGTDLAERARQQLTAAALAEGEAATDLRAAERRFAAGSRHARSPVLMPVRVLPVAGRQLRSVIALAGAAETVAAVGADAAADAADVLAEPPATGPERVAVLREVASIARRGEARISNLDLGPDDALFGPLARRRATFVARLDEVTTTLHQAAEAATAATDLMDGPSRYLLLAANNAEMRAGSGMFLSAGVLSAADGHLELTPMEQTTDLFVAEDAVEPVDVDFEARWGWLDPNQEWRNLGVTPRFDVTAELAADMWQAAKGEQVDGVLAVDIAGLRALLAATGPVVVDDRKVDRTNVVDFLMHDQYDTLDTDYHAAQRERREVLGGIAQATVKALSAGQYDLAQLAEGLADAAAARHLMMWSRAREAQSAWEALGLAGAVEPDGVLAAVLNRSGTKLDHFLKVTAHLSLEPAPDGDTNRVTVTVDLHNRTPEGEVPYVAGPYPDTPFGYGEYVGLVAVTIPAQAQNAQFAGEEQLAVAGPDGPARVVAAEVRLQPGERRSLRAQFELPSTVDRVTVLPSARIPPVRWEGPADERWHDVRPRTVRW